MKILGKGELGEKDAQAYQLLQVFTVQVYRLLATLIGEHQLPLRFTVVLAMPSAEKDSTHVIVDVCGNGSPTLTEAMLEGAIAHHATGRKDVAKE